MISPFLKSLSVRLSILIIDFVIIDFVIIDFVIINFVIIDFVIIDFVIIDFVIIDFVPKNQTIESYVRELISLSLIHQTNYLLES